MFTSNNADTPICLEISTSEDARIEPTESFSIEVMSSDNRVNGGQATILILDIDGKYNVAMCHDLSILSYRGTFSWGNGFQKMLLHAGHGVSSKQYSSYLTRG